MQVRNKLSGKVYVVAESRLSELPSDKPKKEVLNGSTNSNIKSNVSSGGKHKNTGESYELLDKFLGASLVGMK